MKLATRMTEIVTFWMSNLHAFNCCTGLQNWCLENGQGGKCGRVETALSEVVDHCEIRKCLDR